MRNKISRLIKADIELEGSLATEVLYRLHTLLKSTQTLSVSFVKFSSATLSCEFHALGHPWCVSATKKPPSILCLAKFQRCSAFLVSLAF